MRYLTLCDVTKYIKYSLKSFLSPEQQPDAKSDVLALAAKKLKPQNLAG